VDDELDAFCGGDADFKRPSGFVSSDQARSSIWNTRIGFLYA
jgi:hypothetical protein